MSKKPHNERWRLPPRWTHDMLRLNGSLGGEKRKTYRKRKTILYYNTLHYTTLHYDILYYTILYYTIKRKTNIIALKRKQVAAAAAVDPENRGAGKTFEMPAPRGNNICMYLYIYIYM